MRKQRHFGPSLQHKKHIIFPLYSLCYLWTAAYNQLSGRHQRNRRKGDVHGSVHSAPYPSPRLILPPHPPSHLPEPCPLLLHQCTGCWSKQVPILGAAIAACALFLTSPHLTSSTPTAPAVPFIHRLLVEAGADPWRRDSGLRHTLPAHLPHLSWPPPPYLNAQAVGRSRR